ncbi:MAG TPA: hypothetical protein VMY42_06715 [Thermoguttaceae bacterium]|nr:hypothetical protein [Thermoguttaceae bacterium]
MAQLMDVATKTATTAEAITQHRLVRFDSSLDYVYCDSGELPIGPVDRYRASGVEAMAQILANKPGTVKLTASGAISALARVFTADDGKITATNTGVLVGVALLAATADGDVIEVLPDLKRVPYVNTVADSVKGATSTAEVDCGITFTVPANELIAGSIIRVRAQGIVVDQDTTPQCDVKLYAGTEIIATATVGAAADNDQCLILADIVIRTIGSSGTLVAFAAVSFDAAATALGSALKASATEDTTSGLTIKCTVQFNASHADNTFRLDMLEVEHIR